LAVSDVLVLYFFEVVFPDGFYLLFQTARFLVLFEVVHSFEFGVSGQEDVFVVGGGGDGVGFVAGKPGCVLFAYD
jgi:hypothetical protein